MSAYDWLSAIPTPDLSPLQCLELLRLAALSVGCGTGAVLILVGVRA